MLVQSIEVRGGEMTTSTTRRRINFLWILSTEALAFVLVVAAYGSAQVTTRRFLNY